MAKKPAAGAAKSGNNRVLATNRKARHNYSILDTFEAGIALMGTEVKSLRDGAASLADAFATVDDGEIWLRNLTGDNVAAVRLAFKDSASICDDGGLLLLEIFAAQMIVTGRGVHLHNAVKDFENGNVERAPTQIEYQESTPVGQVLDAVGQGGGCGFVQKPLDLQARKHSGSACRASLLVVEVGWNRDDRLGHRLAKIGFGVRLQLAQDQRGQFLRQKIPICQFCQDLFPRQLH